MLRSSRFRDAVRTAMYTPRYSYPLHPSRGATVARGIWSDNMWSLDRRAIAAFALTALASLGGPAWGHARGENPQERYEHRPSERERQAVRRESEARQSHRTLTTRAGTVHTASGSREYPLANHNPEIAGRLGGAGRVSEVPHGAAAGQVRVVRYGNPLSGTVERTIRPGLVSRTFVSGGHVLYAHVYERHIWHQFGRNFAYETYVPAVRYPATFYSWALAPWPRPVTYSWGWQVQPWYPMYGALFTPYPVYSSPDLWMTDYIIARSMQTAYQAQTAVAAPGPPPEAVSAVSAPISEVAAPAAQPGDALPVVQPDYAPPMPQADDLPAKTPPPAITPQVKAQLDAQIKVQLREQQAAAAMPVSLTTQSTPPALRPNHVFFQVVQPLEVPSGTANRNCSLSPDDYIKRTGAMSNDDWKIAVVVELSGPSDCPQGLQTRIGLNDLNAMENEQEAQVMEAMRAASKSMGPDGPPGGTAERPSLIAAGNAAPDPGALEALRQTR
jgi:hypothetical protein